VTVTITSPVLGKAVGETYTGPLESWLLAQGYASQAGYTGPGVSNTGNTDVAPANDPRLATNREAPYFPLSEDRNVTIANDNTNLTKTKFPAPVNFDVDTGGTDTEAVTIVSIEPNTGKITGGTKVTIVVDNGEGTTGVTFGGVAGVSLDTGPGAVTGLVAIGLAAACWAGYILLGRRVARAGTPGASGLAVAMAAGGLVFAPFLAGGAGPVLHDARLAAVLVAVAVCSSVVPYAIEQVVLRRVSAATFAVLLALLPATAAVVGAVVLRQVPHGLEVVGLVLVSGAIALTAHRDDATTEVPPPA